MNGLKSPMPNLQSTNSAGLTLGANDMHMKQSMMDMRGQESSFVQNQWM